MSTGIYTAMSAASAQRARLDDVSDRLANKDTAGYVGRQRRLVQRRYDAAELQSNIRDKRLTAVEDGGVDMRPGAIVQTERPLDVILEPGRFLKVRGRDGQAAYTRAGNLRVDAQGRLSVGTRALLDVGGRQVEVPPGELSIGRDGALVVGDEQVGQLAQFSLRGEVTRVGADEVRATADLASGSVETGNLEMGASDPLRAVVQLVTVQRQFDHAMQAVDTYSRLDQRSAELGRIS